MPVVDVWHSLTERCFVLWLQILQASVEVVKVSRGKTRNRLLCTGALIIQLMGGNKSTMKRGWVWQCFGQEGNWRIFPWLNHAVNPWAYSCPHPKQAVSRCITMKFTNLQILTGLIKCLPCTAKTNTLALIRADTLHSQTIKLKASVLYVQPTPSFISHKNKFGVLILFMKTPKIFSKVMRESVCALWSRRTGAYRPFF